jgi:SagB-type dehydrogenase family enzyme
MKNIFTIILFSAFIATMNAQDIKLAEPQKKGGMPLMEALSKRSTSRAFDTAAISNQQLSNLLWAAFGINRPDGKRTAPSARNFQENEIYVMLKSGVYIYGAKDNMLNLVLAEDIRNLGGTQGFIKDAPVQIIIIADLAKAGNGKPEEKMNTANIDAGHISQNIYLYCASEGLATGARGSIDRDALTLKLKLRPEQRIIIAHSVGYPKK